MSTLQQRLDRIREGFEKEAPEEVKAVMARAAEDLRASDTLASLPAIGSELPAFELLDTEGHLLRSADLVERGPLVVTLYRGQW